MSATRTAIAGIQIPDSRIAREATELVQDLGLVAGEPRSEAERFEIDGANAARNFLESHGVPEGA